MIVLILGIYSYPSIKTTAATGFLTLPPASAPDISLYLNISRIRAINTAEVVDPYYGVTLPVARMGYLKFRLAFLLFGQLSAILHGNLWWSLFLWNLFWWGLICGLALRFFRQFLPEPSSEIALAGLAFLMLFNFGILQSQLTAWVHFPSIRVFENLQLSFIRPFFPQVPVALLILYLILQVKALQKGAWWSWSAMGATQFIAFAIFPYAMLMMAGVTAVGSLGQFVSGENRPRWRMLSIYAIVCATSDLAFFFHGPRVARAGAPGQYSLIHLQMSALPHRIGGMWLVLALLTALVFAIRNSIPEVRWTLVGLGLSNLILLIGDVFFSETALQVSHHGGYFVQLTAALLFSFLVSVGSRYLSNNRRVVRLALGAVTTLLVLNGILIARATYRLFLPANQEVAELARFLQANPPQTNDLVIARSLLVDDDCGWVPLVSTSHPLFCRSAQVLLSPEQNQQIQRFRQALYLYFIGKDTSWVEHVLDDPNASTELQRLMFLGQFTTSLAERKKGMDAARAELLPVLTRVEQKDSGVQSFFSQYRRVFVVDNLATPYFHGSRLTEYLKIENQQTFGGLLILTCSPREP